MNAQNFQIGQIVSVGFESKGIRTSVSAKIIKVEKTSVVISYERDGIWLLERIKTA